jgi:hypothetical protein
MSWNKAPIWGLRPVILMRGPLSEERMSLLFTIAADPCQRSHSRVRDPRIYFTVSDSRLPFSSLPTTHRVTVKLFDPASTRETLTVTIQSELLYDLRSTANQFVFAPNPLRLTARIFCFQLNTCDRGPYIISSLTRGWFCQLQLLLDLASAFILGSESRGARDNVLMSQILDFPFCRLLRLAGLRWRYSTPPPHGKINCNHFCLTSSYIC